MMIEWRSLILGLIFCGCSFSGAYDYSSVINHDSASVLRTYSAPWAITSGDDAAFKNRSLRFALHDALLDTFHYPSWYSPQTRLDFNLDRRRAVTFEFSDTDGKASTRSVHDTLEAGRYWLSVAADSLQAGVYFWRRPTGDSSDVRKFLIMK